MVFEIAAERFAAEHTCVGATHVGDGRGQAYRSLVTIAHEAALSWSLCLLSVLDLTQDTESVEKTQPARKNKVILPRTGESTQFTVSVIVLIVLSVLIHWVTMCRTSA